MHLEVVDLPNSGIVSTEALLAVLGPSWWLCIFASIYLSQITFLTNNMYIC